VTLIFASQKFISSTTYESIPTFHDRYLQEVYAWIETRNACVDAEVIMEGADENNPRVKATRERMHK